MRKETNNIICRCEEVTEEEIREAIKKFDLKTMDEVKRITRAGMGLCQGRTCGPLIEKIISEETDKKISELLPYSKRPPVRPVKIGLLVKKEREK